ncbi:Smr/MutS family protein [Crocinitomix catalasitica]|uniref:Smr/MutS family protein n=1 Tax=Crocinitomix catalasitica TaxID=184607 RepID=UPI000487B4B0|nr:Smr/MutS family protein [Crocinitomix catalasitica]
MSKFNVKDRVSVLNDTLEGEVIAIVGSIITIEDADGFTRDYTENDLALNLNQVYFDENDTIEVKDALIYESEIISKKHVKIKRETPVIDLHIERLLDRYQHLTNAEIVVRQISASKEFITKLIRDKNPKGILIHGIGAGALKSDLQYYLDKLMDDNKHIKSYESIHLDKQGRSGAIEIYLKN